MKKENLTSKLLKIGTELKNNSFTIAEKNINVRFQDGEVLFYSYDNYDSPIIFYSLNKVIKHFIK